MNKYQTLKKIERAKAALEAALKAAQEEREWRSVDELRVALEALERAKTSSRAYNLETIPLFIEALRTERI